MGEQENGRPGRTQTTWWLCALPHAKRHTHTHTHTHFGARKKAAGGRRAGKARWRAARGRRAVGRVPPCPGHHRKTKPTAAIPRRPARSCGVAELVHNFALAVAYKTACMPSPVLRLFIFVALWRCALAWACVRGPPGAVESPSLWVRGA